MWASKNHRCLSRPGETSVNKSTVSASPQEAAALIAAREVFTTLANRAAMESFLPLRTRIVRGVEIVRVSRTVA